MYRPFEDMPDSARLWVYQSNRMLTEPERASLENNLMHLCETWLAHGAPLKTSFKIDYNRFVILAVDERDAGASGCSIDGSVRLLKGIGQQLEIDFFDRSVAFLDSDQVRTYPMVSLKTLFNKGALKADSVAFNNTVTSKAEWVKEWKVAAKHSWLSRYLPKAAGVAGHS